MRKGTCRKSLLLLLAFIMYCFAPHGFWLPPDAEAAVPNLIQNPNFSFDSGTTKFSNWNFSYWVNAYAQKPATSALIADTGGYYRIGTYSAPASKGYVKPGVNQISIKNVTTTSEKQSIVETSQVLNLVMGKTYRISVSAQLVSRTAAYTRFRSKISKYPTSDITDNDFHIAWTDLTDNTLRTFSGTFTASANTLYLHLGVDDSQLSAADSYSIVNISSPSLTLYDTTKPQVTASSVTSPAGYTGGANIWTNQNTTVRFTASDDNSGIDPATYEVSTNGGVSWGTAGLGNMAATGVDCAVTAEGTTSLLVKVKDFAENVSNPATDAGARFTVNIDKTKPIANYTDGQSTLLASAPALTFSDALSGLASAMLNGAAVTSGYTFGSIGLYTLELTDRAGNVRTVAFTITDGSLPQINLLGTQTGSDGKHKAIFHIHKASGAPIDWATVKLYVGTPTEPGAFTVDQQGLTTSMSGYVSFSNVPAGAYTVIAKDTLGAQATLSVTLGPGADKIYSVSIPTKLMFAAFATGNGDVTSPVYHITNNSPLAVKVTLTRFDVTQADGVTLTATGSGLRLTLTPLSVFSNGIGAILPGTQAGGYLGTLGNQSSADKTGTFRFDGRYYDTFSSTAKRPVYSAVFQFEMIVP